MAEFEDDDDINDFYDDTDDCDCTDYDVDLLEGRAWCMRCERRWWLTDDQISAEIAHQAAYFECVEEEEARQAQGGEE